MHPTRLTSARMGVWSLSPSGRTPSQAPGMAYWPGVLAVRLQGICWDHVGHRDPNLIISEKKIYIYIISESFSKALGPGTQHHPTPPGSSGKKNLFGWDFGGPVSFLKSQVFDRPGFSQSLLLIGQEPGLLSPTRPGLCFRTCQNLSWNPLATYTEH